MTTLRIEHSIHDYDLWQSAFDRMADQRAKAGVAGFTVRLPEVDLKYLTLDLEFASSSAAAAFALFLETRVWTSHTSAPALAGVPRTRILEVVRRS